MESWGSSSKVLGHFYSAQLVRRRSRFVLPGCANCRAPGWRLPTRYADSPDAPAVPSGPLSSSPQLSPAPQARTRQAQRTREDLQSVRVGWPCGEAKLRGGQPHGGAPSFQVPWVPLLCWSSLFAVPREIFQASLPFGLPSQLQPGSWALKVLRLCGVCPKFAVDFHSKVLARSLTCRIKSYTFDIAPIPRSRPIDDFLRGLAFVRPPSASSVHPSSRSRGWAPLSSARPHLAIAHHQHCCGEIARGHEPSQDGTGRRATQITDETSGRRAWWGAVAVAATRWHQPAKQHLNLAGLPQALSSSSIQCLVCVSVLGLDLCPVDWWLGR